MNLGALGWNGYTGTDPKTAVTMSKLPPGFHPFLQEAEHDYPMERPRAEFFSHTPRKEPEVSCERCYVHEKQAGAYRREIMALERSLQQKANLEEAATRQRPWSLEKVGTVPTSVVWGAA